MSSDLATKTRFYVPKPADEHWNVAMGIHNNGIAVIEAVATSEKTYDFVQEVLKVVSPKDFSSKTVPKKIGLNVRAQLGI